MNNIQVFENKEFGKVRIVNINEEPWFVGRDVAVILGYTNPPKAIRDHINEEDKTVNDLFTVNGTKGILINESGLYDLILSSKLESARKFRHWVTAEVLPSIRKTGKYISKPTLAPDELLIRKEEVSIRKSELWMKLADRANIPEFKQIADTYAANTLAGKEVIALPEVNKKTFSATEIGNLLGVSANKIGKLSKQLGMKIPEYGKFFYDKAKGCNKQVETFRYYESAIDVFTKALQGED